jgi:hypothetical protein
MAPFLAFDAELLIGVPARDLLKVKVLESLRLYNQSKRYYLSVPGSAECLEVLSRFYNILIVKVGPKHTWEPTRDLLATYYYNTLCCVKSENELKEQLSHFRVVNYLTMIPTRRSMFPFATEFSGWDELRIIKATPV